MTAADYPLLRAHRQCPLCGNQKPKTALACWECWNTAYSDEFGIDGLAEDKFGRAECALMTARAFDEQFPKIAAAMAAEAAARGWPTRSVRKPGQWRHR